MYKVINMTFETDEELQQQLAEHTDAIHNNMLYGIDKSFNEDDDITIIAWLNHEYTVSIPKDQWIESLEFTLKYFITKEEYEKCSEVKQLIDKLS